MMLWMAICNMCYTLFSYFIYSFIHTPQSFNSSLLTSCQVIYIGSPGIDNAHRSSCCQGWSCEILIGCGQLLCLRECHLFGLDGPGQAVQCVVNGSCSLYRRRQAQRNWGFRYPDVNVALGASLRASGPGGESMGEQE